MQHIVYIKTEGYFLPCTSDCCVIFFDFFSQIVLNSLHRYEPRITIVPEPGQHETAPVSTSFPETRFIAVTAYQNEQVNSLDAFDMSSFGQRLRL